MKKLNKILAAISTAALTFCVWGTQTQAKVVTNENDVPTHIEADNKEEFFRDLQRVLNYIGKSLVTDKESTTRISASLKSKYKLDKKTMDSITPSAYYQHQFDYFTSNSGLTTVENALGYLYKLLRTSSVNTKRIDNIWELHLVLYHLDITAPVGELVFTLPEESDTYYTPNLRWYLCPGWRTENELRPRPTTFIESLLHSPEGVNMTNTDMYIVCPDVPNGTTITSVRYATSEMLRGHTCILQKLISIAGKKIEDKELRLAFKSPHNLITDYDEFVKEYNKQNK